MDCLEFMKLIRETEFVSLRVNGQYYDFNDDYIFTDNSMLSNFELDNGDMIHLNDHIDQFFVKSIPFNEALKMVKLKIRSERIKKILK